MAAIKKRCDGVWWRGVLLLAGLLVLVTLPGVALPTTTVQDTVYRADGTPAQGTVLLSWSAFTAADGSAVAAGNKTLTLGVNGALSVTLTPNAGATPLGSYYTAVYHLSDGTVEKEYWVVPQGGTTTLSAIRANVVPAAVAQTWSSQASVNAALSAMQSSFLPLKGGTVSGPITLPGDPSGGLQAATKQYVDSRTSLPANAIPYQGSAGVVAATFDKIVAPFHSTAFVPGTITNTSTAFNEGAVGSGLIGTRPAVDVPGSAWTSTSGATAGGGVFVSGGAQFGPANGSSSTISLLDTGKADLTWSLSNVHLNGSASGGFQIYVRANNPLNAAEVIQWNPGGMVAIQDATGGGSLGVVASAQTNGLSGDIVVTVRGQTITVTWFGTVISGTIPTNTNSGNTFIGFNPYGSLGGSNDWTLTVSSMSVTSSGLVPSAVACNGIVQSDGTCGTVAPNQGVATDANGHATPLPEVQYSTDSVGNTTIACEEDHSKGIFDPRCTRVEKIDGNNTVVSLATSPALALQETANEANCWVAQNHRAATVDLPPGNYKVGLPTEPTLTFGPGTHVLGSPGGTAGVGGNGNVGGTVFSATYTNSYVVQVITPYTSTCADGTTATNGMDGGVVENLQAIGCTSGGCINAPGDTNTYGGGGPNQGGIFVGLAHGIGRNLRSAYTGGVGVQASGLDSEFWDLWAYSALSYYRYDRSPVNGVAYKPATDGIHGGVELNTGDGRFHHIETYGSFTQPGAQGSGASELGHVCGVVVNGGNSTVDDIFEQIDEMGICRPYGGNRARITNIRAEGNAWASVFNGDSDTMIAQGTISQGCTVQATVTAQGYCDDLVDVSASGGTFVNLKIFDNNTVGTSYRTGYIAPGKGTFFGVDKANGDSFDPSYGAIGVNQVGLYSVVPEVDPAYPNGGVPVSGSTPDLGSVHRILMQNASPTNITDVTNPMIGQALHITLASANDVLVSLANGGKWRTCTGQNITGPAGPMTFWVFSHKYGYDNLIAEECDPPSGAIPDIQTTTRPYVDVRTFGAKLDGVTDDTAAINNAITAAHRSTINCGLGSTPPTASCNGVVLIPNGALLATQIAMKSNVTLQGTGWQNTVLVQKVGANQHFIVGTTSATDQRFSIRDLFINGNGPYQGVTTSDCIHFDGTGALAGATRSPRHTLENVFVAGCAQDAISIAGDAGSDYLINVKGMNSGRYGLNLNVYDSHVDVGEFASNGSAGVYLGANGNGSVASVKSWGNGGTSTTGAGYIVNSGNYRLVNNEAQDNSCNGFVLNSVTDSVLEGFLADGNGFTGGGNGCAGLVLNGSNLNRISGVFRGVTDAGQSDYAIAFTGSNSGNLLDLIVDNPKVGTYSGSSNQNTLRINGSNATSASQFFNNGSALRGYSDTQNTPQWSVTSSNGQANFKSSTAGTGGFTIYSAGGSNNFDFTNTNSMGLTYTAGKYQLLQSSTGTGGATGQPLYFGMPIQLSNVTAGNCLTTTNAGGSNQVTDSGYHCTQPRSYFSGYSGTTFTSPDTNYGGGPTPSAAITVTGIDLHLDTTPVGCVTMAVTGLYDETAGAFVSGGTIPLVNSTQDYRATLDAAIPAGHRLGFGTQTLQSGCTTNGGGPHFTVEYVMQ